MTLKLSIFLALFFTIGCSAQTPTNELKESTISVQQDTLPFPVYTSFSQLEPQLFQNNDTTYVVNFWATWCKPCVAELPYFEKLHESYSGKAVKVFLISLDFPRQIKTNLIPFVKERNLKSSIAVLADMDYNAWIDKVSVEWDGAIPFTLIYKGKERLPLIGEMPDYQTLENHLLSVMD